MNYEDENHLKYIWRDTIFNVLREGTSVEDAIKTANIVAAGYKAFLNQVECQKKIEDGDNGF